MQHTHRFQVAAPVRTVFDAFCHLEQLAPCFPGATLAPDGDEQLTGTLAVKVGPVPLHYVGTVRYQERSALRHRVVVQARGEDERGLGGAAALVTTELAGRGAATDVTVHVDLDLTGTPSRYGTAVADDVLEKLFDQFGSSLAARLGGPGVDPDRSETLLSTPVATTPPGEDPVGPGPRRTAVLTVLRRHAPAGATLAVVAGLGLFVARRRRRP